MFEVYYINGHYPERGEMLYGKFDTYEEANDFCIRNNYYSKLHHCFYWIVDLE